MVKSILGLVLLAVTLGVCAYLYYWISVQIFEGSFEVLLLIGGVTFLLASGILLSAMLLERGRRRHH